MSAAPIIIPDFIAITIGIIVYFIGIQLDRRVAGLRTYNIPEPVTGGVLAALILWAIYALTDVEIRYDLASRDLLLVYFFTSLGINADLRQLLAGGRPLMVMLALTLGFIIVQDVIGVTMAAVIGEPSAVGVLAGSASLIGGHGTTIAWAPEIAASYGIPNALELGVASATLGLVLASLLGGPIAKMLLPLHRPKTDDPGDLVVGVSHDTAASQKIDHLSLMSVMLTLHVAIVLGFILNEAVGELGLKLPLFVSCLLVAIAMTNTIPRLLPNLGWPAGRKALAVVSDFSLGIFIAMSLMSMQLWTLVGLAGPLLAILAAQVVAVILFIRFILFPAMGRDYQSVVLSAGFAGFALGATPTAVANMTAVTKSHGAAPQAFIILPLIGAFFVDISNAFVIQYFLSL